MRFSDNILRKGALRLSVLMALFLTLAPAKAVTDKEMEQARTITAQAYLRYANNGSGYLDDLSPKTMAELEQSLKAKEKENLRSFKAVSVPKDYASWDKEKLTQFWGTTFFASPGLIEEGRAARTRVRARIGKMTVAAPAAEAPAAQESAPAPAETPSASAEAQSAQQPEAAQASVPEDVLLQEAAADTGMDMAEPDTETVVRKKSSSTWIYIAILCVLVGVVIWLVVYAGNAMKSHNSSVRAASASDDSDEAASEEMRRRFAETLSAKNEELKEAQAEAERLRKENARLRGELETARREAAASAAVATAQSAEAPRAPRAARQERTIWLGRVNKNGIFVRADRAYNPGNSFYKLTTTDGVSGSFSVVTDPTACELALLSPDDILLNACAGRNLTQTRGMKEIVTEMPGTAVFEGGCWRVGRKARIVLG